MSKKDFELIARVVSDIDEHDARNGTAVRFADALAGTNPRFNRTRFLKACGASAALIGEG